MPAPSPPTAPFRADRYDLPTLAPEQATLLLMPVAASEAGPLAARMAAIPPWSTYGVSPAHLESLFRSTAGGVVALAVRRSDTTAPVGVVVIRSPWLIGPYVQFLGLDPVVQGQGLGRRMLHWLESEARQAGFRNLWICAAGFNEGAQRLYHHCGFETVAALDDLIQDGVPELLMRKKLT